MPIDLLRPLIVPREYIDLKLPAPHLPLAAPDLALTWVELADNGVMLYVTPQRARAWEKAGIDWRRAAMDAMQRADEGHRWTHEKRADDGELQWVAMMHEDGLGSSRLLQPAGLGRLFPDGYWVALPDRSCGIAASKRLGGPALEEVRAMVEQCYTGATTPMCRGLREPADLLVRAS